MNRSVSCYCTGECHKNGGKCPLVHPNMDWMRPEKSDCLFDKLPTEDKYKAMGMSCPCKKCSPWSM